MEDLRAVPVRSKNRILAFEMHPLFDTWEIILPQKFPMRSNLQMVDKPLVELYIYEG